jgi:chemotaxis protein methyltransferase WspC
MTPAQSMLRHASGLNLGKSLVDRAVGKRMEFTGHTDQQAYVDAITPAEMAELVELLVVPESWFYRDAQAFQAALEYIRERVRSVSGSRPVRILSIPCAGGEEPYTMAMVLADAGLPPASYLIEAWDISSACIARAREGIYGRNAFRASELGFRDRYFTELGDDEYRINDALRLQIRFKQGNLLEFDTAARQGQFDVIFCRNLLIYFDKPTTKAAIARLSALLADDGLLFAGYAEVPSFCQHGFTPLQYPQAFGLRKDPDAEAWPTRRRATLTPATLTALPAIDTGMLPVGAPARAPIRARAAPATVPGAPAMPPAPGTRSGAAARPAPAAHAKAAAGARTSAAAPASGATPVQLLEQARRLADLGQAREAEHACRQCLAQTPDSAEAYFILGLLSEHAGKPDQAAEEWRRCLYLQPDHYEALCHLALLAEQRNDASGAAALKARAARIYQRQSGKTPKDRNA